MTARAEKAETGHSRPPVRSTAVGLTEAAGAFARAQPEYAARGIATFPVRIVGADKKPAVKRPASVSMSASTRLRNSRRFDDCNAIAFIAGKRSRISVLDIDSPDEKQLADALAKHGPTPIIVRTGRGNFQAWYRNNGEGRHIRPWPGKHIDVLGSGPVVAPPSQGAVHPYELIEGSLDDIDQLPVLQGVETLSAACGAPGSWKDMQEGDGRNNVMFPTIAKLARSSTSFDVLLAEARDYNEGFGEPLPADELIKLCRYWWERTAEGENKFGIGRFMVVDYADVDSLMASDPDGFLLLTYLRRKHWGRSFTLANATCRSEDMPGGPWRRQRFTAARDRLIAAGRLRVLQPATLSGGPMLCQLAT